MAKPELAEAAGQGDLEAIRRLLDDGADIRYVRPHGYTVMIDVMHGRSIIDDTGLLAVLWLLIDRGADLDAVSDYGESALSVVSRVGRFDAVELLLGSGANPAPLEWTALHRAVALGTIAEIKQRLDAGDDVAARDRWERTPLLLSLQTGDIEKAEALLSAGGSLADRGRCGKTPLMYPLGNDDPAMLRWLLERGVDPNATDDFGGTALIAAAGSGTAKCVRALLDAGADPNLASNTESPIRSAANLEVAQMLAEAGADFAAVNGGVRDEVTGRPRTESITCTPEEYHAARHRVFGNAHPQIMNFPFWRAMVTSGQSAYHARAHFDQGRLDDEAVWCFDRFGKSFTALSDRRVIEIAGEHEDYYDPDFCIYNDVIVHHGDGMFDIYGYPRDVFPPTDFHTATLVGSFIYIVGNLGYMGERRHGTTQVYRLDVNTLAIEPVETFGESPGWLSDHKARLIGNGIEVTGGKVCGHRDGKETYDDNHDRYVLDLCSMTWSKNP
jgi:ankyrin repeat protein